MPEYLLILLGLLAVSFFLHKKFKLKLFENKRQLFAFYLIAYFIGIVWDNFAIWRGHWSYPGTHLLGINLGLAPIEDYLFILACNYFAIVVYKTITKL